MLSATETAQLPPGQAGPRSHPERYSLESAGAALGLTGYDPRKHTIETHDPPDVKEEKEAAGAHGKKEFYEMCEVLSAYEGHDQGGGALRTGTDKVQENVSQGATRPSCCPGAYG